MHQPIKDIVSFIETHSESGVLRAARDKLGDLRVRLVCIKLAGWWRRSTLMQSRHPCMKVSKTYGWYDDLCEFVEIVPGLSSLVRLDEVGCHFADAVTQDERRLINEYVRENYKPPLRTRQTVQHETI